MKSPALYAFLLLALSTLVNGWRRPVVVVHRGPPPPTRVVAVHDHGHSYHGHSSYYYDERPFHRRPLGISVIVGSCIMLVALMVLIVVFSTRRSPDYYDEPVVDVYDPGYDEVHVYEQPQTVVYTY